MKFLVDMPLSPKLSAWLSERGYDAVHTIDRGLSTATDLEILELAQKEGRIVITADPILTK